MSQTKNTTVLKVNSNQKNEAGCDLSNKQSYEFTLFLTNLALLQSFSEIKGLVNTSQYLYLALESAHEETSSLKSSNLGENHGDCSTSECCHTSI